MKLFDFLKRRPAEEEEPPAPKMPDVTVYSGMRVEVTGFDGRLLFVAKLMGLRGDRAELLQYSDTTLARDQEPLRVRIRGYHDHERKAVYMEGTISPLPQQIWLVEKLVVSRIGNDRAFFRLDTDLEASAITFQGLGAGERPCRLLNISVGGACIRSVHEYHKGDKFLLKVKLLEDREPSAIFCQVLRVVEKKDAPNEYGCQFLELNVADQDRITENIFAAQRKKRGGM